MKERKQIALISIVGVLLTLIFIILVFTFLCIYYYGFEVNQEQDYHVGRADYYLYRNISYAYQTDKEVIEVYELCLDSEIKSVCVYENINFTWSKLYEPIRKNHFFSPTEMVKQNGYGVCRDIAVFRMAIFKKLGIPTNFVFSQRHVYIRAFEDGKIYELDNSYLRID